MLDTLDPTFDAAFDVPPPPTVPHTARLETISGRVLGPRRRTEADIDRERAARRAYYASYGGRLPTAELLVADPGRPSVRRFS